MKRPGEAIKVIQELISLSRENYVSPDTIATVFAGLGGIDSAIKWLKKVADTRSVWQIHLHLKADPRFKSIRKDPRSREILANKKHKKILHPAASNGVLTALFNLLVFNLLSPQGAGN
jgi:hypothetical protein